MIKIFLIFLLSLTQIVTFSQGLPTGTCNESGSSINTIFYPNTTQYYNNNNIYQENLYLCGPNVTVYDTTTNTNNCRTVFLNSGAIYYTSNTGGLLANFILAKNNSTVVILPNANSACIRIYYESSATIIDQTSGTGMQTYTCSTLIFPTVNCTSTGLKENNLKDIAFELYPNPANDKLNIEFTANQKEFRKAQIINSLGILVKETDVLYNEAKPFINVADLPNGVYILNLKNNTSNFTSKRFTLAK